jgi:hypothetical protein
MLLGPAHPEPASPDESPAGIKPGVGLTKRRRLLTSAAVVLTATTGVTAAQAATAAVSEPTLKQRSNTAKSCPFDRHGRKLRRPAIA